VYVFRDFVVGKTQIIYNLQHYTMVINSSDMNPNRKDAEED